MVVFGSLINSTDPAGISLSERPSFSGLGFSNQGIPIDVVGIFLAGLEAKNYTLLLVDEFQRLNGVQENAIHAGMEKTRRALACMARMYSSRPAVILASEFMGSEEYGKILKETEEQINDRKLKDKVMQTVPVKLKMQADAAKYTTNEIACTRFLGEKFGINTKLGPSKEMLYDSIMRDLGLAVDFAYFVDAYALGTREPETVVHYVPEHKGKTNGQRLLLDEPIPNAVSKLLLGPDEALRYMLTLASASGFRMGKGFLTNEEIQSLKGRKLKGAARKMILENILLPYQEAKDE